MRQVFDSFGPNKAPAALFLDYGFTDVSAAAAHRCTLPAALLGLPAAPSNSALLRAIGIRLEDSTFQVLRSSSKHGPESGASSPVCERLRGTTQLWVGNNVVRSATWGFACLAWFTC